MKTLVSAINKGGQGKTFATCHLAFDFAERGLRVVVLDFGGTGNASLTLQNHHTGLNSSDLFNNPEKVAEWVSGECAVDGLALVLGDKALVNVSQADMDTAAAALRQSIAHLSAAFDVCLIDTDPTLGVVMQAAILAADYMLSPLEMAAYSFQGITDMLAIVSNLSLRNPKLKFLGMVPNRIDARISRQITCLAELRAAYPQLVIPVSVGARDSIAEALELQKPVWKIRKTAARAAAREVRQLAEYVYTKMEISQ
jgi:chromosome partitioning protein